MLPDKTTGIQVVQANYTEKQFLSGTIEQQAEKVIDVLKNSSGIHRSNRTQILYFMNYLYGDQDIKFKEKLTRTEINHKSVENWAYAFVDWKKNHLLGKPMQYSPITDVSTDEMEKLNQYATYENKSFKDLELYGYVLTCGRGFRYNAASPITEEDESPFEIINVEPWKCETVYSSGIRHEQLCSYIETDMKFIRQEVNPETNKKEPVTHYYKEYTVYTRNYKFVVDDKNGFYTIEPEKTESNILKEHKINEYYVNSERVGLIELGRDLFNDLNYLENLDMDDVENFVNSIMVFTNAEVDKDGLAAIKDMGAVSIKSTDQKKASIDFLQSRLKANETEAFYLRKLQAAHNILGIPQAQNNGAVSNAETGKAMLTGQGFTSASIRIEGEEEAFRMCDRNSLKTLLKICKSLPASEVKTLKVSDVEIKFNRDMSDNLLTKTQALMNLLDSNVPPEVATTIVQLFSDPVSVAKAIRVREEEKQELQNKINQFKNITENQEQNNDIQDIKENDNQGN